MDRATMWLRQNCGYRLLALMLVMGCDDGAPQDSLAVVAGSEVEVLKQTGKYAQIRLDSGETGFIEIERLEKLESGGPAKFLVVEDSTVLEQPEVEAPAASKPPRPRQEILQDLQEYTVGYMATDESKIVLVPQNYVGPYRDPESGQWCWPAYVCNSPNCPKREGDERYIFPARNPTLKADENGDFTSAIPDGVDHAYWLAQNGLDSRPTCPACKEVGGRRIVSKYIPPESAARKQELLEEYRRMLRWSRK